MFSSYFYGQEQDKRPTVSFTVGSSVPVLILIDYPYS